MTVIKTLDSRQVLDSTCNEKKKKEDSPTLKIA